MQQKFFFVVFRTGGTVNFKWHRSLAMPRAEAEAALAATQRAGHKAHIVERDSSLAIGLPETFE